MENQRKEYTFVWCIENYSCSWHKTGEELVSPPFTSDWLEGTVWNLKLYPRGKGDDEAKSHFTLCLFRSAEDDGPESISIESELSALSGDGSPLFSWNHDCTFERGSGNGWFEPLKMDEILLQRKEDYLPQDILTLRCKIWKGEGNVHNTGQCSARTRIKVEKISFLHVAENFASLETKQRKTIQIRSQPKEERFISSSLHITSCLCCEEKIVVEIAPSKADQILLKCEISLLDASGNAIECGKADTRYDTGGKSIDKLPLSLTRAAILDRKNEYLPDDKLSLQCDCTFSCGIQYQDIEETLHGIPSFASKQESDNNPRENSNKAAKKLSANPSALEDLKALYLNQSLTDVRLKTKTKSFPAHKSVLCARSPVFTAMLVNDMKEKNIDCIQVDDLEEDVVEQWGQFTIT